jgi:hypothetical protein
MFAVTIGCRQGVAPEGHEILAQVSVGLAAKRLEIIAQGFYEAELVKAGLQKSNFFKFCFVWTAIR